MPTVKLISFELKLEFEIADTDYDVVWNMDNIVAENMMDKIDEDENKTGDNEDESNDLNLDENDGNIKIDPKDHDYKDMKAESKHEVMDDENTQAVRKGLEFGKQADMFRESWGLQPPPTPPKKPDDEAIVVSVKDSEASNDQPDASTEASIDEESDSEWMNLSTDETSTDAKNDDAKHFSFKLGAGSRSIMLSRKSLDSASAVFSKSSKGLRSDEKEVDFCKAWIEAVIMSLERRVAAGYSVEEVYGEFITEMGLDKLSEIVDHFLGRFMMEQSDEEGTDMDL